jgi:hypothetical protein
MGSLYSHLNNFVFFCVHGFRILMRGILENLIALILHEHFMLITFFFTLVRKT